MKTIELTKGIKSSVIGFGCAPILGAIDSVKARRALDCAIDYGINHLDLARSYGYGEAEKFVGNIIYGQRDKLVLASKFGIKANWRAKFLKPVKPLIRLARNKINNYNSSNSGSANSAHYLLDRVPLNGYEMQRSLEKSLKALRTDYLDYYFVHEPSDRIVCIDELTSVAESLKSQGKIRAWGIAYMKSCEHVHREYLSNFDILQFNNSPELQIYESVVADQGLNHNIIFSPFRGKGIMSPSQRLKKLIADFPNSVILCSMFNEKHIRDNVELVLNG